MRIYQESEVRQIEKPHSEKQEKNAKPFVKWVGGKRQLLYEIEKYYPFEKENVTKYVEPFVGGGAVFFDILNRYDLTLPTAKVGGFLLLPLLHR